MAGHKFEKARPTDSALLVHFRCEVGNAAHMHTVRVPWESLITTDMLAQVDRAATREMARRWATGEEHAPLF